MSAKLTFFGGAKTVTGANFLLETGNEKLLVDCGSVQDEHNVCDTVNARTFPYEPNSIAALFITHAHQDHIGRVPKLVHDGFRGAIHSTPATRDLAKLMFEDALHVMEDHAKRFGCAPLYEAADVELALSLWQGHEYRESFTVGSATVAFHDAGHILGSAMVELAHGDRPILFTGDLGNSPEPLLPDTEEVRGPAYIVMESAYGDRVHEKRDDRKELLRSAVEDARRRKGVLLIPSFSIERTQVLLYELNSMVEVGAMKPIPVYLDAPLAESVTEVYRRYPELYNADVQEHLNSGDDIFAFRGLTIVKDAAASHALHKAPDPKVIIAGAGMSSGGRIRAHELQYLPDANASILFVGYQAPGSLGRRIADGAHSVEIDGRSVQVRAHISQVSGYSGHADRDQLLDFVEREASRVERIFVAMGETKSELYLAQRIKDFYGIDAVVPNEGQQFELDW